MMRTTTLRRAVAGLALVAVASLAPAVSAVPADAAPPRTPSVHAAEVLCPYQFIVVDDIYVFDGNYYFRSYYGERILGSNQTNSTHRLAYRHGDAFWVPHSYIQRISGNCFT
jgi:hypothetical protein